MIKLLMAPGFKLGLLPFFDFPFPGPVQRFSNILKTAEFLIVNSFSFFLVVIVIIKL